MIKCPVYSTGGGAVYFGLNNIATWIKKTLNNNLVSLKLEVLNYILYSQHINLCVS